MNIQNQSALKKLYQVEKMASLGRMAAGLAHELNNAIGVIQRNTEWLSERSLDYIQHTANPSMFNFFEKGLKEGQTLSTIEIRKQKRELEKKYVLTTTADKKLATAGLSEKSLKPFADELEKHAERIHYFFETGLALHDMMIAANHASRVVQSVKELGASSNPQIMRETDINKTLREAVSLLKRRLEKIKVDLQLKELTPIMSNPGELVQIWVNLIKNAAESMNNDPTVNGVLKIRSQERGKKIIIKISDNGPGIPPDLLPIVFQPNITTKVQGLSFGLGLGLPIVERLVEKYGGIIDVKSTKGNTTFTIEIPLS
jgi:C4-dicarboxylate-specific signal transduction histidine kinase